jgi:NitT/TauT family transport system permease protein
MAATDIALEPAPLRKGRAARTWAGHLFTLVFLGTWELASLIAPSYLLPGPGLVALRLWSFVTSWRDLGHLGASLFHVGAAIAISFVIGSLLALIPYYVPVLRFAIERRIGPFLNAFSAIGWTLLAIMWFGVTPVTVIFTISAVLVPFALVNMSAGLASFTRRRTRMFALVIVPSLYPFIFATLRIMFGVAWKVTLTAELFGGNSGLGYMINLARQEFDTATIFAAIILIIAFVHSVDQFVLAPLQASVSRPLCGLSNHP